jgi:glycosyltransferase involved in cell wall biosynthesis
MRICIVDPFEHGGGAEYQISLLIEALAASGSHDVHYLAHFVDDRPRTKNYQVSKIGSGPLPRLGYLADGPSLYRELLRIDPDVIYQRVACGYTGVCAFYARRQAVPMVWHVAHDSDVAPTLLETARNKPRQHLEKWSVAYGARHADHIVVQTRHQADLLQANFGRKAAAVIPNFHPPAPESIDKSGPLTVVWIANLKQWKQPEIFIRLAQAFVDRTDVRFVMIGAPPALTDNAQWRESIMAGIKSTPNLQFLGLQGHAQVNQLLAGAHVFVNTSLHEGFPNTFIQAWMREVAVVSLAVDPDGVLQNSGVGLLAGTEPGLAAALRRLIEEPQTLAEVAKRGRGHADAQHSMQNSRLLVQMLEALAEDRRRAA